MRVPALFTVAVGCAGPPAATVAVRDACLPTAVAVDDANVYWTSTQCDGGSIHYASKSDGSIQLLAANAPGAASIAVDSDFVYWAQYDRSDGKVLKISKAGGNPIALAEGLAGPNALMLDDANVYWQNDFGSGGIFGVPKDGSSPPAPIADGYLALSAADGTYVYWVDTSQTLYRRPNAGGVVSPVFSVGTASTLIRSVVVTGASTFVWAVTFDPVRPGRSTLYDVPTAIAEYADDTDLALAQGGYLYWITRAEVLRTPMGGGGIEVIATHDAIPVSSAAADSQWIYWVYGGEKDGIYRAAE